MTIVHKYLKLNKFKIAIQNKFILNRNQMKINIQCKKEFKTNF